MEEAGDELYNVEKRGAGVVSEEFRNTAEHKDRLVTGLSLHDRIIVLVRFRCKAQSPPVFRLDESWRQNVGSCSASGLGTSLQAGLPSTYSELAEGRETGGGERVSDWKV